MRKRILVDVRSSREFELSHIPNALNLPVLDDEEYEKIGTLYHQSSFYAKLQGGVIVCQNIAKHLENPRNFEIFHPKNKLVLYCARGGQRSRSFWNVLREVGFDCERIEGGYKAYRQKVLESLQKPPKQTFLTLYGMTGCGKSDLIAMQEDWSIDIEGLAKHYGSSFGDQANGFQNQPSGAMFENLLYEELQNKQGVVLAEGESKKLGNLVLPTPFFDAMHCGVKILITSSMPKRVERIVKMYHSISAEKFAECMQKIRPYLQKNYFEEIIHFYHRGDLYEVAGILLEKYYDCVYRQQKCEFEICSDDLIQASAEIEKIKEEISRRLPFK